MHPQIKTNLRHRRAINAKGQPVPTVADELAAELKECRRLMNDDNWLLPKSPAVARYEQERKP